MALVDDSINEAIGIIVNDLSIEAFNTKRPVVHRVPVRTIVDLATEIAEGQGGYEEPDIDPQVELGPGDDLDDGFEIEPIEHVQPSVAEFRAAIPRLVSTWNAQIHGDAIELTVPVPQSSLLPRPIDSDDADDRELVADVATKHG